MSETNGAFDYGRLGDVRYAGDDHVWRKTRTHYGTSPLQILEGGYQYHLGRPPSFEHDGDNSVVPTVPPSSLVRQTCADAVGADNAISRIVSDERFEKHQDTSTATTGDLFDLVFLTNGECRKRPLLAYAAGERGQLLCVAHGLVGRVGWENDHKTALATTHFDEARSAHFDAGEGTIMQLAFSGYINDSRVLIAVRYARSVKILVASTETYRDQRTAAPTAVYLRTIVDGLDCLHEQADVVDMCFRKRRPFEIFTAHADGRIRLWSLPRHRHEAAVQCRTYSTAEFSNNDQYRGMRIASVTEQWMVFAGGIHVLVYEISGIDHSPSSLDVHHEILDLKQSPGHENLLIVLTTEHVLWIRLANTRMEPFEVLRSWVHHRDSSDRSLRLTLGCHHQNQVEEHRGQTWSVLLYSRQASMITEIGYGFSLGAGVLDVSGLRVHEPIAMPSPVRHHGKSPSKCRQWLQLALFPTPKRLDYSNSTNDNGFAEKHTEGACFYQAFMLEADRSVSSYIYYRPGQSSNSTGLDPLAWKKTVGRHLPLSGRVLVENFVVDSDEEDEDAGDRPADNVRWWRIPRQKVLIAQRQQKMEKYSSFAKYQIGSNDDQYARNFSLASQLVLLSRQVMRQSEEDDTATRLFSELVSARGIPSDLFEANDRLQSMISESAVSEARSGGVRLDDVRMSKLVSGTHKPVTAGSMSLRKLYILLIEANMAPWSLEVSTKARSAFEKVARQLAAQVILSATMLRPCDIPSEVHVGPEQVSGHNVERAIVSSQPLNAPPPSSTLTAQSDAHETENDSLNRSLRELRAHVRSSARRRPTTGAFSSSSLKILTPWNGDITNMSAETSMLDLFRYDQTVPQSEAEQEESQRQLKKLQKRKRKIEEVREAAAPSSQPAESQIKASALESGRSQLTLRPGLQSSQRLDSSQVKPGEGPSSSWGIRSLKSQLATPPSTQSQSQSQQVFADRRASPMMPDSSLKRSSQVVLGSQTSMGLQTRKRRKAGF